ncbi:HAD-superfamily hydrolase, subfamily IIA [Hyphomicrobium sulfonivorans]|uniref:HAD-superfamily hydrolase, subfamily IIA n=1 Tax=Hyphomicrobium sulfonivorans TaxID=121290 RepID=A0A109BC37_HYPSL|nr:TIGR01459 family HAD-type hydrolase [Hyphomicrobium sulfonivorans]KWT66006.1 HAD-superfamily hydrolase, subfamily IIA [Hyphomicrobium sulfonivorans]
MTQNLIAPPILAHAGALLSNYDVIFCDVWGVLHDGLKAFPTTCDALQRFRNNGGTVVLVSNAPVPGPRVSAMLESRAVPDDTWDDIVSSGELALQHADAMGYRTIYCIGPTQRDAATFLRVKAARTDFDDAEAILCTGLNDDMTETADDYRPLLEKALARKLPFICANPDLVVDVGGKQFLCAGAIADLYERMGGEVFWAGKPFANAYEAAHASANKLRGAEVPKSRIVAVGDSLRTDLKGAEAYGIDAIFVASGIHREETMGATSLSEAKLQSLFAPPAPQPIAVMEKLVW